MYTLIFKILVTHALKIVGMIHLFNVSYSEGCVLVVNLIYFSLSTKHHIFNMLTGL